MSYEIVTIEVTTYLEDLEAAARILRQNNWSLTAAAIEAGLNALPEPEWEPEAEQVRAYQDACAHDGLGVSEEHARGRLKHLHTFGVRL